MALKAMTEYHVLSSAEIELLRKQGMKLDNSKDKLYIQSFLINDKQNNAGDPDPFKVAESALDGIAKSAINRPWILPPEGEEMHVIGPKREFNAILEYQKAFAAGEIVSYWINPQTKNVNVIIDVFPEYQEKVKKKEIPPFVSPLLQFDEVDPVSGEVTKARVIHLQSVNSPGYEKNVAKINGLCEGGLKQCMAELRIKGASSSLNSYQELHRKFFNQKIKGTNKMSNDLTLESLNEQFTAFKQEIGAKLEEISTKIKGASAAIVEAEQGIQVNDKTKTDPKTAEIEDVKSLKENSEKLKQTVEELQQKLKEKEEAELAKERLRLATEITEAELKLKEIPLKDREKRIKFYNELKENDTPVDLKLLHKALTERANKIKGAAGFENSVQIAEFTTQTDKGESQTDYWKMNEALLQ